MTLPRRTPITRHHTRIRATAATSATAAAATPGSTRARPPTARCLGWLSQAYSPINPTHYTGTSLAHSRIAPGQRHARRVGTVGRVHQLPRHVDVRRARPCHGSEDDVSEYTCVNCHLSTALPLSSVSRNGTGRIATRANACIACHGASTLSPRGTTRSQVGLTHHHAPTTPRTARAQARAATRRPTVSDVGRGTDGQRPRHMRGCHGHGSSAHLVVPGALRHRCPARATRTATSAVLRELTTGYVDGNEPECHTRRPPR